MYFERNEVTIAFTTAIFFLLYLFSKGIDQKPLFAKTHTKHMAEQVNKTDQSPHTHTATHTQPEKPTANQRANR